MSIVLQSSGGGQITLQEPTTASNFTQTLPAATGAVVLDSATQTLTNKTIEGGTVISGTAVASTSGTSIDFTSIPSWVKRITVVFQGVSVNGTSSPLIQIGPSSAVETTGYISTGAIIGVGTGDISTTAGFLFYGDAATDTISGTATIVNITGNSWVYSSTGKITSNKCSVCGGDKTIASTLARIRITTVNGTNTFDAGSINILYE